MSDRGAGPRDYQARVLIELQRAVRLFRGETLTVMFPRQAGKNEVSAMLAGALLVAHAGSGGSIVVCAPTAEPQVRISAERTRRYLARAAGHLLATTGTTGDGGRRLNVGQAAAIFLSASPSAHVAGHTASIALLADEAQEIETEWFERQFRPMTASTGAPVVLFGTAWDGESLLERAAERNRRLDAEAALLPARLGGEPTPRRHYQAAWREVGATLPDYLHFVEKEQARLGVTHPLFLTQYELEAAKGAGRLLGPEQLARLRGAHARLGEPAPGERYAAGLDLGGDGRDADASVLTIARAGAERAEVVAQAAWRGAPYAELVESVAALARRWGIGRLCVDATGLGGPLADGLARLLGEAVEPVVFTAAAKSALGWGLVAAANAGTLALHAEDGSPEAAETWRQLRACRAELRSGGGLRWGDDSGHDDHAISLALCLRAAQGLPAPRRAKGRVKGEE